jgi:hypothetical protein
MRICIGAQLALTEVSLLIATMARARGPHSIIPLRVRWHYDRRISDNCRLAVTLKSAELRQQPRFGYRERSHGLEVNPSTDRIPRRPP